MNSCRKRGSTLPKYPCTCWLCLMKEFRQKHEEKIKCKTVALPGPSWNSDKFVTGSSYDGGWQEGCGMHGYGVYTFPNGVIYEGEFFEGAFHGKGELRYRTHSGKAVIRGQWYKGLMTERTLLFGALEHDPNDWQYCKMPDRRFKREYTNGVQPAGKSFLTAKGPYVDVPEGCYDTGDGIFDITRKMIFKNDDYTKIIRDPGLPEQRWIQDNCRTGKKGMTIGPRLDFYEKFMEATTLLEPVPPPAAKFWTMTRKESTFEKFEDLDDAPLFYDSRQTEADARPPERKFHY